MAKYIKDLSIGDKVEGVYLVVKKSINDKRDGAKYIYLELVDKTGQIPGLIWNNVENWAMMLDGECYIKVRGSVKEYNRKLQIIINSISKVTSDEVNIDDLFKSSPRDLETLKDRLGQLINSIENPKLKALLDVIFQNQAFYSVFIKIPAAISKHHAYLNGLLDHTIEVCDLILGAEHVFPQLNHDLLLAGALIHDIGKVEEYKVERGIEFTEKGNLIGHVVIGYGMAVHAIEKIEDFPEELEMRILHMILSHHGKQEWGSPRRPVFPEAYLLHSMDNLSSKIHGLEPAVDDED